MKQSTLNIEIIKKIFINIGVNGDNKKSSGLYCNEMLLSDTFETFYDDNTSSQNSLYSGFINFDNFELRGLLVDLSEYGEQEFLFCWTIDDVIVGISIVYDNLGECAFKRYNNDTKNWTQMSLKDKSLCLAGFEDLVDTGLLWSKNDNYNDLKRALMEFNI